MHILFLSQLLPYPPDAGPKVRSYYVLRHLARSHKVTLLAFTRPDDTPAAIAHLEGILAPNGGSIHTVSMHRSRLRDAWNLARSWLTGKSFIINRDWVPAMAALLDKLAAESSPQAEVAFHADQLWMAQYALNALSRHPTGRLSVLDEHNACYQIFKRLAANERNPLKRLILEREWRALRRYEAHAIVRFDHLITVTHEDRQILQRLEWENDPGQIPSDNRPMYQPTFHTIPICVDTNAVEPVTPLPGARDVLHLGTMFWMPNVEGVLWFAEKVWSRVLKQVPEATFTIVGKNPPISIRRLAAESTMRSYVTGYVKDPQLYLQRGAVFIVPLLSGGGMRVKIIDAWRWGLPVVSTTIGAEGIEARDGENILIADDPACFASAVTRLLIDPDLNARLRQNGRAWVKQRYHWQTIYTAWDAIYHPAGNTSETP